MPLQFKERYRGYKIPLLQLRNGSLTKHLRAAGSKIVATPEQAQSLNSVSTLVTVSETLEPTVQESEASDDEAAIAADAKALMASLEEAEDDEDPYAKAARKKALNLQKITSELRGKFVDLTDLLPPVPKKGSFQVEDIKGSQYFFS